MRPLSRANPTALVIRVVITERPDPWILMKKKELLAILSSYGDDDEFLVEDAASGFDEPSIYVAAVRPRSSAEFVSGHESDYVADRDGQGCIIIGTSRGCFRL